MSPWLQGLRESLEKIGSTAQGPPAQTYYGSPVKLEQYRNAGKCN